MQKYYCASHQIYKSSSNVHFNSYSHSKIFIKLPLLIQALVSQLRYDLVLNGFTVKWEDGYTCIYNKMCREQ